MYDIFKPCCIEGCDGEGPVRLGTLDKPYCNKHYNEIFIMPTIRDYEHAVSLLDKYIQHAQDQKSLTAKIQLENVQERLAKELSNKKDSLGAENPRASE